MKKYYSLLFMVFMLATADAFASQINIIAAENFYGALAREIGGTNVQVTSIINNPKADPHLFTTSSSTAKTLANTQIIIYNGAGYDDWMGQMLTNIDKNRTIVINVANLVGIKPGQNPHLWYKIDTFPQLAKVLNAHLTKLLPDKQQELAANLNKFTHDYAQLVKLVHNTRAKYSGTPVTATEPIFGYMADNLGLKMQGLDFQWKIMNDTEPAPKMIANYQSLLTNKKVKVLFYNNQVADIVTKNMLELAKKNRIAIIGISETMPADTNISRWLINEVAATAKALAN